MVTEFTFDYDLFSDLHKDAYGMRPRGHRFYDDETTDAERQQFWDTAIEDLDIREAEDKRREEAAIVSFEQGIAQIMKVAGVDRATAIRYEMEAGGFEHEYDPGYVCYCYGLPYHRGYEEEFKPFIGKEA